MLFLCEFGIQFFGIDKKIEYFCIDICVGTIIMIYRTVLFWSVFGCMGGVDALISPLRTLISSQAFVATFLDGVVRELPEGFILNSLLNIHFKTDFDVVCLGLIGVSVYFRGYRYNRIDDKWTSIEMYSNIQKITRVLILVLIIILTKNVENVI